ncbi:DUF2505 domain-containing protein [Mycolicibacterium tusciae]|uniref:DUF2505 domain-containing protein n=1 Tax=Mycolicibacterium tusciae TaxID=75922 RepID=UPI00024A19C3|nr:DUF2505 domain-containing protein [Mycolicibacterium tusciae]
MSRSVDFSVDSSATVEQLHSAFSEESYWRARLATFGGFGRLDSLTIEPDGSTKVVIVQDLHHEGLPALVAKLFPKEWRVVQTETWSPISDGRLRGEISIISHGAPGSGLGTAVLAPAPNGSRLNCSATVEFRVPLIGGKVESLVSRLLAQQISGLQRYTVKWITEQVA